MCKENPYVSYIPKIHKEFIAVSPDKCCMWIYIKPYGGMKGRTVQSHYKKNLQVAQKEKKMEARMIRSLLVVFAVAGMSSTDLL